MLEQLGSMFEELGFDCCCELSVQAVVDQPVTKTNREFVYWTVFISR